MNRRPNSFTAALQAAILLLSLSLMLRADNRVLGEVQFDAKDKVAETSGVWIDGQYLGFVGELKGNKKVLLLPGSHQVSIRQAGYLDFNERISVEPGKKVLVVVVMQKDFHAQSAAVTAQIKIDVSPDRAAVILDGTFAGTAHEFGGMGRAMLVNPGKHHLQINLPGYRPFDTELNLLPYQKITIKTKLEPGNATPGPELEKK
jgi:PEGA domain-containing protein